MLPKTVQVYTHIINNSEIWPPASIPQLFWKAASAGEDGLAISSVTPLLDHLPAVVRNM